MEVSAPHPLPLRDRKSNHLSDGAVLHLLEKGIQRGEYAFHLPTVPLTAAGGKRQSTHPDSAPDRAATTGRVKSGRLAEWGRAPQATRPSGGLRPLLDVGLSTYPHP